MVRAVETNIEFNLGDEVLIVFEHAGGFFDSFMLTCDLEGCLEESVFEVGFDVGEPGIEGLGKVVKMTLARFIRNAFEGRFDLREFGGDGLVLGLEGGEIRRAERGIKPGGEGFG